MLHAKLGTFMTLYKVNFTVDSFMAVQCTDRGEIGSNGFTKCPAMYVANSWHVSTLLQDVIKEMKRCMYTQ